MPRPGIYADLHGKDVMAMRPSTRVQNITVSGVSAASTVFTTVNQNTTYTESAAGPPTMPLGTTHVRLCATTDCYVVFGASPTATAGTGTLLPANSPEYFPVDTGDQVAVIQVSAGGTLNIVEMT